MKTKIFIILALAVMAVGSWTCKKDKTDDDACSTAWATELSDQINAMSAAAQAYATNPTYDNCIAYKDAAQAYLNALEPYGNCAALTGQEREAWQSAFDDAQQSLDNMDCTKSY